MVKPPGQSFVDRRRLDELQLALFDFTLGMQITKLYSSSKVDAVLPTTYSDSNRCRTNGITWARLQAPKAIDLMPLACCRHEAGPCFHVMLKH